MLANLGFRSLHWRSLGTDRSLACGSRPSATGPSRACPGLELRAPDRFAIHPRIPPAVAETLLHQRPVSTRLRSANRATKRQRPWDCSGWRVPSPSPPGQRRPRDANCWVGCPAESQRRERWIARLSVSCPHNSGLWNRAETKKASAAVTSAASWNRRCAAPPAQNFPRRPRGSRHGLSGCSREVRGPHPPAPFPE
jgi:hypothetical protein